MSRLLVEGQDEFQLVTRIAGVAAVAVEPAPAPGVVRDPRLFDRIFGGVYEAAPMVMNGDSVLHTFRSFLRGTGVPGGAVQLGQPATTAPYSVADGAILYMTTAPGSGPNILMPGQRIDLEMQEAVATVQPVMNARYTDYLAQSLRVLGYRYGNQVNLVTLGTPSILDGPPDDAALREVVAYFNLSVSSAGSFFLNRDFDAGPGTADKTVTLVLHDPGGLGDATLAAATVAEGDVLEGGIPSILLSAGQSLELTVAENTISGAGNEPLMFWVYRDILK